QPGKNSGCPAVGPMQPRSARAFPQIIIRADFGDLAVGNDDGAIAMAAERTVSGRVDKTSPDCERVGRHSGTSLVWARVISAGKSGTSPQKKDSGSARRRNNKYEKRAAARIALTCLFGQRNGLFV